MTEMTLDQALELNHPIIRDTRERVDHYGDISARQAALVLKIAREMNKPTVPAPTGRVTFTGTVQSVKEHFGSFGETRKMTVKVSTEAGYWLAWGTVPASLDRPGLRGSTVEITATLSAGREPHFAFFKRPRGRLVSEAA